VLLTQLTYSNKGNFIPITNEGFNKEDQVRFEVKNASAGFVPIL
jgi:hypothetical protein